MKLSRKKSIFCTYSEQHCGQCRGDDEPHPWLLFRSGAGGADPLCIRAAAAFISLHCLLALTGWCSCPLEQGTKLFPLQTFK